MKFMVNAAPLRVAGGRAVGLNFLKALGLDPPDHDFVVYAPAGCGYEELAGERIRIRAVPDAFHRPWMRPWVDDVWMPGRVRAERPDALFSMGNLALRTEVPQLVLFHWSYAIYAEAEIWDRMSLRERLSRRLRLRRFQRRIRQADRVAAQTEVAARRLQEQYGLENVAVVPNSVSLPGSQGFAPLSPEIQLPQDRPLLLCLTRYYPHKNLDVLLGVARRLRERAGVPWSVVTTVAEEDGAGARAWLAAVRDEGLGDVIRNVGPVPGEQVPALYAACDGLLLPTLLESLSGTYIEAMHFGKPVLTSDRDFARTVCGDDAYYFDPHDPDDIVRAVDEVLGDDDLREARIAAGRERSRRHPSWSEVARQYVALLEELAIARARAS